MSLADYDCKIPVGLHMIIWCAQLNWAPNHLMCATDQAFHLPH